MTITNPAAILIDVNGNSIGVNTNPLAVQVSGSLAGTNVYTHGAQLISGSVSVYTQGAQLISGTISILNTVQSGSTALGFPTLVGGTDTNGILRGLRTDTSGKLFVSGSVTLESPAAVAGVIASGSAATFAPVLMGGVDGGNLTRALSTDFNGRLNVNTTIPGTITVVGNNASGTTATANPVLMAGADVSGFVRGMLMDSSGRQIVVGTTLSGSTAANAAPVIVAGTDVTGFVRTLRTDTAGAVSVTPAASTTGTQSSVAASATNVTILAANSARKGATIFNDGNKTLSIKLGATASSTSFSAQITARGYYEVPFGYTGIIDGIWDTANGSARVTELTL